MIVCTTYNITSFTNNGNGILQVSKMEGKLQCASACHRSMAARRRRRRLPRRLCQFLQWNFHILFQLHCIKSFMHLSFKSLLGASGCLLSCCYLLQMFKVSLFIIYTATVLDFVEVEHYIHNQAHNGYIRGLRTPNEGKIVFNV